MKKQNERVRVKGFTLVEMITVIAIIGILLGILTPAMMSYIRRSRIQAANADAKLVYNAAQTEVQKFIARDRTKPSDKVFNGTVWIGYNGTTKTNTYATGADPSSLAAATDSTLAANASKEVIENVNRLVSGASDVCWAVNVENYIVQGCVSASVPSSRYIGFYTAGNTNVQKRQTEMSDFEYQSGYINVLKGAVANYKSAS